jgi:predicted amidohydrolase
MKAIVKKKVGKISFLLFIMMIMVDASLVAQQIKNTPKRTVKVAMIQMKVVGGQLHENLTRAESLVKEAATQGADVAVLPECMDLGWTHPSSLVKATAIPDGEVFSRLSKLARRFNVFICSGLTERDGDKVYNSAVLIDNQGNLLLKHRKINELDIGKPYYATGDRINVVDTSLGRLGLMICADASVEDRSIITSLARMEPNIILSPSAWAVPPGYDNVKEPYGELWRNAYQPISGNFEVYIISVSNVGWMNDGPWKGWDCIGASLAFDNKGKEMLQCPFGVDAENITYVDCTF